MFASTCMQRTVGRVSMLLEGVSGRRRYRRDSEGLIEGPQIERWTEKTYTEAIGVTVREDIRSVQREELKG